MHVVQEKLEIRNERFPGDTAARSDGEAQATPREDYGFDIGKPTKAWIEAQSKRDSRRCGWRRFGYSREDFLCGC